MTNPSNAIFGFLAVTETSANVCCGGLLALTATGRPLEFHCTAPVMANRAQQILFGATLKEYLVCDQIGRALIGKLNICPDLFLVDDRGLIPIANQVPQPVIWVERVAHKPNAKLIPPNEHQRETTGSRFDLITGEMAYVERWVSHFTETLPLWEPFQRIYQAIEAAQSEAA